MVIVLKFVFILITLFIAIFIGIKNDNSHEVDDYDEYEVFLVLGYVFYIIGWVCSLVSTIMSATGDNCDCGSPDGLFRFGVMALGLGFFFLIECWIRVFIDYILNKQH